MQSRQFILGILQILYFLRFLTAYNLVTISIKAKEIIFPNQHLELIHYEFINPTMTIISFDFFIQIKLFIDSFNSLTMIKLESLNLK